MRRLALILLPVLLILAGGDVAVAKQNVTVELFYSGVWNHVSTSVYTRDQIFINHGAGNEQSGVVPSDAALTFKNRDGEMNPDNRQSTLFGKIGHNTPLRISVAGDIRFSGQVVSWKPRRALGTLSATRGDAWVEVKAQGVIRRLGQGDPPKTSALTRFIRTTVPLAWWPLEVGDQRATTSSPSGLAGGSPLLASPAVFASHSLSGTVGGAAVGPPGSSAAVDLSGEGQLASDVPASSPTAAWRFEMGAIFTTPVGDFDGGEIFRVSYGAASTVFLSASTAAGQEAQLSFFGGPGAFNLQPFILDDGAWHHIRADFTSVGGGASTGYEIAFDGVVTMSGTATSVPFGNPTRLVISSTGDLDAASHPVFWSGTLPASSYVAFTGHAGETAGARFTRLCAEEDITSAIVGTSAETQLMGPQYPDTTLNLLGEIAKTDAGTIHDTRASLGLTFRTGRSLYNQ